MIPSRFRPVRLKKRPKTCDFGGRQTSCPIKWGLVVSHPSNIANKSYFSYARYHSQQITLRKYDMIDWSKAGPLTLSQSAKWMECFKSYSFSNYKIQYKSKNKVLQFQLLVVFWQWSFVAGDWRKNGDFQQGGGPISWDGKAFAEKITETILPPPFQWACVETICRRG